MLAIYKREMRSYFTSWIGYIFLAIAIAVSAFIFCLSTFLYGSGTSDTATFFSMMIYLMIIFLPILTMRSFSEERKQKTEVLLMTSPVSSLSMVLGKYLSALTMFLIYIVFSLINLIPLCAHATFDTITDTMNINGGMIFGSYIALFLVGAAFIAIGIFVSSLTENQFATLVLTIVALLSFMLLSSVNNLVKNEAVRRILSCFSIYSRFTSFTYGIFDYTALIYYLMLTGLFIFLTARVYKARRDS